MPAGRPEHPWDSVADEVSRYIQEETEWTVQEILGEHRAPFAADISETDKLGFFRRQFYAQNPDGSPNYAVPNQEGRQNLYSRMRAQQYHDIAEAVGPKGGIEHMKRLDSGTTASEDYETGEY